MDMDNAAVFLAGSILYALGIVVIIIATVVVNNIVHKYWKSWGWKWMGGMLFPDRPPVRFMTDEEAAKIAPHLEDEHAKKETSPKV